MENKIILEKKESDLLARFNFEALHNQALAVKACEYGFISKADNYLKNSVDAQFSMWIFVHQLAEKYNISDIESYSIDENSQEFRYVKKR